MWFLDGILTWDHLHIEILSWAYGFMTNNNGFWIGCLDLLTASFTVSRNRNQLQVLETIFSRTILPWPSRARFVLVRSHSMTHFWSQSQSQSYVMIDGQSASLSWNKAPIWGLRPDFHYCQTIAGLLIWGALSDERTDLSFTMYNIQYIYTLHAITWIYIQGLCQSRLSTADHVLFLVASGYEF
jgi:hypothetical protein